MSWHFCYRCGGTGPDFDFEPWPLRRWLLCAFSAAPSHRFARLLFSASKTCHPARRPVSTRSSHQSQRPSRYRGDQAKSGFLCPVRTTCLARRARTTARHRVMATPQQTHAEMADQASVPFAAQTVANVDEAASFGAGHMDASSRDLGDEVHRAM